MNGQSLRLRQLEVERRAWASLATLWAVYHCAVFTVGRFEAFTAATIWGGGALVLALTALKLGRRLMSVPREAAVISLFLGWILAIGFGVADVDAYWYYVRRIVQAAVIVAALGAVIRNSGRMNPFWWSFLVVAVFNTGFVLASQGIQAFPAFRDIGRQAGLTDNANGLGFLCFLGILGSMALVGEPYSRIVRGASVSGAVLAFGGIALSGSRGAFLAFATAFFLWPILCLARSRRERWRSAAGTLLVGATLFGILQWLQGNMLLGRRVTAAAVQEEERRGGSRLDLAMAGLRLTAENPIRGVGPGQFATQSGLGQDAHNEWVELLATTGIPGFTLFMGMYYLPWRRLRRASARIRQPRDRYRVNFARLTLAVMILAGAVFRPNFTTIDTMFVLAIVTGMAYRSEARGRLATPREGPRPPDNAAAGRLEEAAITSRLSAAQVRPVVVR